MLPIIPTSDDVLCGRGAIPFQHPGNKKLREKIAENLDAYNLCESRQGRTKIIQETISHVLVSQGGRFLKEGNDGRWYDGGMKAAKSRVSTAFRDARVPNKVKCMDALRRKKANQCLDTTTVAASKCSMSSAIIELFCGGHNHEQAQLRRDFMSPCSAFSPFLKEEDSSREEESLNSSISTLDSCLMTGFSMTNCSQTPSEHVSDSIKPMKRNPAYIKDKTSAAEKMNGHDFLFDKKCIEFGNKILERGDMERVVDTISSLYEKEGEKDFCSPLGKTISFTELAAN